MPKKILSTRELEIMEIFWKTNEPLVASDIKKYDLSLSLSTVHSALKKLIGKEFIKVAEIVYSGTVLTRSYKYIVTQEDYEKKALSHSINPNNVTLTAFAAAILESENDKEKVLKSLDELENFIKIQKTKLRQK